MGRRGHFGRNLARAGQAARTPRAGGLACDSTVQQRREGSGNPSSGSGQRVRGPDWTAYTVGFRTGAMRDLLESLLTAENAETRWGLFAHDTYPSSESGLLDELGAEGGGASEQQQNTPQKRPGSDEFRQADLPYRRTVSETGSKAAAEITGARSAQKDQGRGSDFVELRRTLAGVQSLLEDVKQRQVVLETEWTRYESLEAARLASMEKQERQRSVARGDRAQLEEDRAEFRQRWDNLQRVLTMFENPSKNHRVDRTLQVTEDVKLGDMDGTVKPSPPGTLSQTGTRARKTDHQTVAAPTGSRAEWSAASFHNDVSTGETAELSERLEELLQKQQLLADFISPLVSLQRSRLTESHRDMTSRQGISDAQTKKILSVGHIKKTRPWRIQRSLGGLVDTRQRPADGKRGRGVLETPPAGGLPEENLLFVYGILRGQHSHEEHFFQQEQSSNSRLGASSGDSQGSGGPPLFSSSSCLPSSSASPASRTASCASSPSRPLNPRKGRRAVYGGFEALDDPPETVASALVRFLSPPFAASAVSGLIRGPARARTQGRGGLAEATGNAKPEWLTDVTVFADAKLNEILEQEAWASGLFSSRSAAGVEPEPERAGGEKRLSPVLAAVRRAETATSLADYFDRVEVLGPFQAKKKPRIGTPQEIIFQYAFDNVPLEHKRFLWREFLQAQLDDRGYDIELPEEPPVPSVDLRGGYASESGKESQMSAETEQRAHHRPTMLDEMAWLGETAGPGQAAPQMPNGLFQKVVDEELTRVQTEGGDPGSEDAIPRVTLEELQELARLGEEKGKLFPYWRDDPITTEVLANHLLGAAGLGNGLELGTDSVSLWEESFESYSEDAELSQVDGEEDSLGWLWDLEFVAF